MNDLYSIGYFPGSGDRYRINFSDSSPLNSNTGSNGALFNLSDSTKSWTGAGRANADTFLLPDNTQLSLDGFVEQAVDFLTEGQDYGLDFRGTDQNDAFYLDGFDGFVNELTSNDVDAWIEYRITEGKDIVVFPDELHNAYGEMAPYGVVASWGVFDDYFWDYYHAQEQLNLENTGFFEDFGTSDADTFYGGSNTITFGLDGADKFTSELYSENQIFVGGEGADTYKIDQPGFMTVFDGGYAGNDLVQATGIGITNDTSYVATIDGRHLWAYDNYSEQGIVVIDFMDPDSKIESIKLQDGTFNYDQIIQAVSDAPNSLGDVSWDFATSYVGPQGDQSIDGTIDFYKDWHQRYTDTLNNHSWDGLTYKFSKSDLQVTSGRDDNRVYVDTKAENVYKVFDNRHADDVFLGSDGMQVVRSEGGYDTVTGGKGSDVFRVDGSMLTSSEWGDQHVYDFVGHQLKVTDYEFGELLSIEDFGLTSASQIYSEIESGYTKIWAQTEFGDYNPIKLVGEFDTGIVYSNGTSYSEAGVDYRIEFFDTSKNIKGTSGDDDLAVFGQVWGADLDIAHIISDVSSTGQLLEGGDGADDFAGGAGSDHFSGGDGIDRLIYFDSAGIGVGLSEDLTHTVIYDGMGYGGVDTLDSIRDLYASTGNDYIDLSTNPDEIERIIPSFGNDEIVGNLVVGYWNLFDSPDDPRYGTEWEGRVQNGVTNAWVEVNLANQLATKHVQGGQFDGIYTDILNGTRGLVGSEGNDIFNVTVNTDFKNIYDDPPEEDHEGWAHGLIGNDFIEDLGSGYTWLTGGAGDDVLISGHYQDVVYGDWESDYYVAEGVDTFAVVGSGYTEIMDWELGEEVWWLSSAGDSSGMPSSAQDIVITYDYGKQTTKLGYQNGEGQVVNRIEINGLLQLEHAYMEEFYAASASASILDGSLDARLVLSEADSLPYQITDLGSGSDKFYGGDEFDLVTTNGGADWIMAGAGDDMVIVNGTVLSTDKNPLDGSSNYVLIDTGTGNDIVNVTTDFVGEVQLVSGGGADTLVVEGEAASFSWGADNDSLVLTSADATLVLTNQMAYDENQVFSYIEFISVDPVTGEETSQIFQIDPNADPVEGGIVTLLGTDKDDTLEIEWDSGPASIAGLKGDDIIDGGMSDDNLDGGEGDDLLFGDSGDDSLAGGEGEDLLAGDHGSDLLFGGLGDDVYKIDLEYDGFLDRAGYDNVVLNEDGTINYELSPETPWDDVIGGVDTITDDGGADRIWITNFQPTLNPFDQYKEMLSIDSDGTLIMKWGWDAESPSSYQYTLKEGFEHQPFDAVTQAAQHNGGYVVTKSNVNSTTEQPTYTWPVFAEKWQAENFYGNQYGWDVAPVVHKVTVDPSKVAHEDGSKGSALEQTRAETLEFWVPGPEGSFNEGFAPDFTSYPGMVNVADTLYYDSLNNKYHQGGDLSSLEEIGQHTKFDLGDIKTWPGFTDLPEATDPANPEIGTQEYYADQFVLGNSDTYPSAGEMPFVEVINNNIVSMADIQNAVDGGGKGVDDFSLAEFEFGGDSSLKLTNSELTENLRIHDDLTIEFWINPTAFDEHARIISFDRALGGESGSGNRLYGLQLGTDGSFYFAHDYGNGSTINSQPLNSPIPLNEWSHIVFQRDSLTSDGILKLFVNGELVGGDYNTFEHNHSSSENGSLSVFQIGGSEYATDKGWEANLNGSLKDIRIYDSLLTGQEVTSRFAGEDINSSNEVIKLQTKADIENNFEVLGNDFVINAESENFDNHSNGNNLYPASISNDNAELAQGFKVTDFAVKDEYGNWVNTIESIVFTSPTGEHRVVDKYGANILDGKKSAYDSLTDALRDGYGTEYFLSPSGIVDLGTVRTPTGFNADGTPKGFKETNNWKGAETDKNFFLIANADMAGLNDSGLGFNGSTSDVSFTGDRDAVDPFTVLSNEIWMSGAAKKDIMVGHDGWDYVDVMFGHGGDDSMMAEGGENYVIGGAGADKFIIEAKGQQTTIYGDHVDVNSDFTDVEYDNNGNAVTTNDSYGDAVFFDFAWPALIPNPSYDPNGPVDAINNPEMIRDGDTYIEQLGNNHFKVHHKLENGEEINVEMYDVEGAYFSDGMGGIEYHALTTGRPITSDDFGKLDYEKNDVKFWVEHNDADYGGATTIAVVTTATKSITDPVTKQKISYEEPTVKWKGLASEANSFEFSDVTINVINVAQTDITGAPIVDATVYGTAGIDLIIGDEFDNLIFGGDDNDIIFGGAGNDEIYGEGGDDVLIGDVGEDILYGDYHEDALKPAEELDTRGNVMNASELDGDDIIVGGDGIDKIDTGEGQNVAASGDLSSVILNAELDEMHTFLDYDEDDLPV